MTRISKLVPVLRVTNLLIDGIGATKETRTVHELHASDLTKQDPLFCPREMVLMRELGVSRPLSWMHYAHAMRMTWDQGHDMQWRINNEYLRDYMVGDWHCLRCDERLEWCTAPLDQGCIDPEGGYHGHHLWEYREPVFHHPSGFSGSLDGIVRFSKEKQRMLEVKIMAPEEFKGLKAPLAEHRVRTQLYLRMLAESEDVRTHMLDTSEAHVLYVSRAYGAKNELGKVSPFREYIVKRDDAQVERYVHMANAVSGDMPEGICSSALVGRAEKCPVAKPCWSGKHPAKVFWRGKK